MTAQDSFSHLHDSPGDGGGEERIAKQHAQHKLTARERLDLLLDPGSLSELDSLVTHRITEFGMEEKRYPGDAVITGSGTINGREVFVFSQDFTVFGGSISEAAGAKIGRVMQLARENGAPLIGIYDSGGARIQEGVMALAGVGEMLLGNTLCSGLIPQIAVVVGPSAGGAVYSPAICDFIFTVKDITQMYITGPDVVRAVTRETISHQDLGGAEIHARQSGVAHFMYDSEIECFQAVRELLGFLPQSHDSALPIKETTDKPTRTDESLRRLVPANPRIPYDMKRLIKSLVDDGIFLELQERFARNIITGFAHLEGHPVGIVAQQPAYMAGSIDINASTKAARFVRFCDAFGLPLVTLVDVPGFMPGRDQEHHGIIRHGAKLIYAYAEATVPKVTVITHKAYGGAYIVMSSKHLRGDVVYAWPTAEIAVMGAEGAVNIIYRKEIAQAEDHEATRRELTARYEEKFNNPNLAAERGYVDAIIDPAETRPQVIRALRMLRHKKTTNLPRKHGNIPL